MFFENLTFLNSHCYIYLLLIYVRFSKTKNNRHPAIATDE